MEAGIVEKIVALLLEQGGGYILAAVTLLLLHQSWKLRCETEKARVKERDEMIAELKTRNDRLMGITERLAEALGKNSEVVDRNSDMLGKQGAVIERNSQAFQELKLTLARLNGKS